MLSSHDAAVNPQTERPQTKDRRLRMSGKFPNGLGVPPLTDKKMLESKPLTTVF